MTRTLRWAAGVAASATALSCSNPSAGCETTMGLDGQWSYEATQESPVPASIRGTMVVAARQCADFQGTLDAVELLVTGESRRVSGFVSGTMLDSSLFRFDAVLAGDAREHLARVRSDSIVGDWVQTSNGAARSGRFAGQRLAPR